jgi:hypothetical protein
VIEIAEYGSLTPENFFAGIAISADSAPACFSGAPSNTLTIRCSTTSPRISITPQRITLDAMDPNAHATFVVDAVVDETNDITIPSMPFTVECTAVETPGKGNIVFPFTLQSIMQPSISKFCLYVVQAYSCEHLSSSSFLIMMLAIIRKIIMILAIILIRTTS